MHCIYKGIPSKNERRTLYVGRTCQDLQEYVTKRYRECFHTDPSCMRKLYSFLRTHYKTTENASFNIKWVIIDRAPTLHLAKLKEQMWINRLNPELNGRNEMT